MKCRVCRGPAVIDIRRHNAGFCRDHFLRHCEEQVRRAVHDHEMFGTHTKPSQPQDRISV